MLYLLGPMFENGYGLCYSPSNDDMLFPITSFRSNEETDSDKYASYLSDALYHMKSILEKETINTI